MHIITFRLFKYYNSSEVMTVTTVISVDPLWWWNEKVWKQTYSDWDGCNLLMIYKVGQ